LKSIVFVVSDIAICSPFLVWRSQTLARAGRVWNQAYIRICSAATTSAVPIRLQNKRLLLRHFL